MSETRFTPGPWWADEFRPRDWRIAAGDKSDGCWWIAEVGGSPNNEEANACLIAAAPDLYAALELYVSTYAETQVHPSPSAEVAVLLAVRAALARARGES